MSMLWAISGAGRAVGKTTVALKFCDLLPRSTYAKCGHGVRNATRHENFFSRIADLEAFVEAEQTTAEHIVIESNAWVKTRRADVVVFIGGVPERTHFRRDAEDLCRAAQLRITPDATRGEWRKVLKMSSCPTAFRRAICDILTEQQRYLFGMRPGVRTKVWIEASGLRIFGSGLAQLLESIDAVRTLRGAADATKMSYRHAWDLIRSAERHWDRELVHRRPGGARGGVSTLSDEGRRVLALFRTLDRNVSAFADKRFMELCDEEEPRD
jgi:molybdate transport repressor ModE-like protein